MVDAMACIQPASPEELVEALHAAASRRESIRLGGRFTKDRLGGPPAPADVAISTANMTRVLQYEPRDLTVSVEAGLRWCELARLLAEHRQMIPLDPPWGADATVGGVVATNCSGPRRRLYGAARDMVIGMKFATLEGKLIQSGGMVVKNVAGLDMAKMMIGSFGTLAGIAVVNFKLAPAPAHTRTFVFESETLQEAIARRDAILAGVLQPAAIDLLNPPASAEVGLSGFALVIEAGGNMGVIERYTHELAGARQFDGEEQESLWESIREFTPRFLDHHPRGVMVRHTTTHSGLAGLLESLDVPAVARAGSGVVYAHYSTQQPHARTADGSDFAMMMRVKDMFDPEHLLNRGRLDGRI